MRDLLKRVVGTPAPPRRSWERPVDTMQARHQVVDMAILNVHICTRQERERVATGEPTGDTLMGDYLEFGVFRGATFLHAHHRARDLMPWMRFFAFDSFEGLPAPEGPDLDGEFTAGQFACSREEFDRNLHEADADMSRIEVVSGWFDEVLDDRLASRLALDVCSIAYIDCDLYKSTVPVLAFLTERVRRGTILIFDDWYCFKGQPDKGVQRATGEWLADNPQIRLEKWHPMSHHGQSFIVQLVRS